MYFYYVVIEGNSLNGVSYRTDCMGCQRTRADVIKYFRDEVHACILNLIELTEEEYKELHKKYETDN